MSKSDVHQEVKSKTIYTGNHRSDNGAKSVYLRIYDRKALADLELNTAEEYRNHGNVTKSFIQESTEVEQARTRGEDVETLFKGGH